MYLRCSFQGTATAWSIKRAVSVARARYTGGGVRFVLPAEPESFFVSAFGASGGEVELVAPRIPERLAN